MKQEYNINKMDNVTEYQIEDAINQVENDLVNERKKYNYLFKKDFQYYI